MNVYFVELVRKDNGKPLLYSAEEAILFRSKKQAEDFIAEVGESDEYRRTIVCRGVTNPLNPENVNRTPFPEAVKSIKDDIVTALWERQLCGIYAKDVLQRAVAKWIVEHSKRCFTDPDEIRNLITGICFELLSESLSEWEIILAEQEKVEYYEEGGEK